MILLFACAPMAHAQQLPSLSDGVPTTIAPPSPGPKAAARANALNKTPDAKPANADNSDAANQKIVNNPFAPGGVISGDQIVTRKDVEAMLQDEENRLRKELSGGSMSADELAKLVGNAATPTAAHPPDNFMGCVNGTPLYRENDGTLDLGTNDPEPIRKERCGQ